MTDTATPTNRNVPQSELLIAEVVVEIRKTMVERGASIKGIALALKKNPRAISYAFNNPKSLTGELIFRIADQLNANAATWFAAAIARA